MVGISRAMSCLAMESFATIIALQLVASVAQQCSGAPCDDVTHCRSQFGFCDNTPEHCNEQSIWKAACLGECGGPPCDDASHCRSEFGFCDGTPEFCNANSIWTADCPDSPGTTTSGTTETTTSGTTTTWTGFIGTGSKNVVAFVENWKTCPTLQQISGYTKVAISFAVSYVWSDPKNQCSTTCTIASPVPICENNNQQALVNQWKDAGKKVLVSFGGAGMGGSWAGDVNDCWEHCFNRVGSVVSQLTDIVAAQGFDGVDIDYEYFLDTPERVNFVTDLTTQLRASLPVDKIISHAPMDSDLVQGTPYYNIVKSVASSLDYLMPQYYNGPFRPATDLAPVEEHYGRLVTDVFGGDAGKMIFGFCIEGCSGNVASAQAVEIMQRITTLFPDHGGAFLWAASSDRQLAWSAPLTTFFASLSVSTTTAALTTTVTSTTTLSVSTTTAALTTTVISTTTLSVSTTTAALTTTVTSTTTLSASTTTAAPTTTVTSTTTLSVSTTTAALTTTVTSTTTPATPGEGLQSGDTIFLKTRSGSGKFIDVEGDAVQARWEQRGDWQAIVIEKQGDGSINSGDAVFLKTHTGARIDVEDDQVRARWGHAGTWQAFIVERKTGNGAILPNDLVCFKAHTGKHVDVEGDAVRARWEDCGDWQTMRIEREEGGAIFSGDPVSLLAHTGNRIDVEGEAVWARSDHRGDWQTFRIENAGGRAIFSGDIVFLQAHTGKMLDVPDEAVMARWHDHGDWQKLIIEKVGGGIVFPGDTVFLQSHVTGNMIDVEGHVVRARWGHRGEWQSLVIEKMSARLLHAKSAVIV